jgi:hypothetical protein
MNCVRFIDPFLAVDENFFKNQRRSDLGFRELRIHIIQGDTGNCDHRARCANFSTGRYANRVEYAQSATKSSPTITTWFRIIEIRKEWVERGETIIRTTFKQHTGGVTKKKDQRA